MTKKDKPLPRKIISDVASTRSNTVVDRTRDAFAVADRNRAEETSQSLKLPDDWDAAKVQALARDLEAVLGWQRGLSPYAICPNDRAVHCAQFKRNRKALNTKAKVFRAAAQEINEAPLAVATTLLWANEYAPGPADTREGLERAAQLILRSDPFPLKGVLLALAREAEKQAEYMTIALNWRGNFTDDWFVDAVAAVLTNHGLKAAAYRDKVETGARGNLVVACAMLRGASYYASAKAFWVVTTHDRIARKRRELAEALAERRRKALVKRREGRPAGKKSRDLKAPPKPLR